MYYKHNNTEALDMDLFKYKWIVTKKYAVRAISKEKLTKRGLMRCIDYYNSRRHNLKLDQTAVCRTARTVTLEDGKIRPT